MINTEQFEAEITSMFDAGQKVLFVLNPAQAVLLAVILRQAQGTFTFTEEGAQFVSRLRALIQEQFPKGSYTHRVIEQGGLSESEAQ